MPPQEVISTVVNNDSPMSSQRTPSPPPVARTKIGDHVLGMNGATKNSSAPVSFWENVNMCHNPPLSPLSKGSPKSVMMIKKTAERNEKSETTTSPFDFFTQCYNDSIMTCSNPCAPTSCNTSDGLAATLGIARMQRPSEQESRSLDQATGGGGACYNSVSSTGTPVDRRRERHARRQHHHEGKSRQGKGSDDSVVAPLTELHTESVQRNISELTMRSSYAEHKSLQSLPDSRRMAFYAVGKHHNRKNGGNRRCYFTGKLILNTPYYAGCVREGLRTLVVFCLPSALGLPDQKSLKARRSLGGSFGGGILGGSRGGRWNSLSSRKSTKSRNSTTSSLKSGSRMSKTSLDDLSCLDRDEDLDPNWVLDRDYLLSVLSEEMTSEMMENLRLLYPEDYSTLPVQVRDAKQWRLYSRFCFFSGMPIAESDLHYRLDPTIAEEVYAGDEILLSHEVMIAVNGTADIVQLPNRKCFSYLQKHYPQQCKKLPDDRCFQRCYWERVAPSL